MSQKIRLKHVLLSLFLVLSLLGARAELKPVHSPSQVTLPVFKAPDFTKLTAYQVLRVVDGDTIIVRFKGRSILVRLIGIYATEKARPSRRAEFYAKEVSRFTTNLLKGEKVYLQGDHKRGAADRHGRMLTYVYRNPDGLFVNAELIRQGYSKADTKTPYKHKDAFKQLERYARHAGKGIWSSAKKKIAILRKPKSKRAELSPYPTVSLENITVFITRIDRNYHRGYCPHVRQVRMPMKLKDAKKWEYTPCSLCRPWCYWRPD